MQMSARNAQRQIPGTRHFGSVESRKSGTLFLNSEKHLLDLTQNNKSIL
jgi:hypothetical protein